MHCTFVTGNHCRSMDELTSAFRNFDLLAFQAIYSYYTPSNQRKIGLLEGFVNSQPMKTSAFGKSASPAASSSITNVAKLYLCLCFRSRAHVANCLFCARRKKVVFCQGTTVKSALVQSPIPPGRRLIMIHWAYAASPWAATHLHAAGSISTQCALVIIFTRRRIDFWSINEDI